MTGITTPIVPTRQTIDDLQAAAVQQATYGWAPVHWLEHRTGQIGIFGALRMAIYSIASSSVDPTFIPSDEQRTRIWRATQVLNEHVLATTGLRYAFDWNATHCGGTDDAVRLFQAAAEALERRTP